MSHHLGFYLPAYAMQMTEEDTINQFIMFIQIIFVSRRKAREHCMLTIIGEKKSARI